MGDSGACTGSVIAEVSSTRGYAIEADLADDVY